MIARATRWRHALPVVLTLCLILTLSCGDSSGPDNGGLPNRIAVGDTVTASWGSDTRDYFLLPANSIGIAVYGDATGENFNIEVFDSATGALLTSGGVGDHPSYILEDHHTGVAELAAGQTARIRLTRAAPTPAAEYQIAVARVFVTPEIHSATLQAGDTVNGETMSEAVDVDRFYLRNPTANPLDVAVFAQSRAGFMVISAIDSTTGVLVTASSFDTDPVVRPVPVPRLPIVTLQAGQTIRIQALQFGPGSGSYQLWLYQVNRSPESIPAAIALHDTIQGETLENSADIDEFTVTVAPGAELIGYYQGAGTNSEIGMTIQGGGLTSVLTVDNGPATGLGVLNTGSFVTPTGGTLTIRHRTVGTGFAVLHPYSFMLRSIDRQPEQIAQAIAVGDSMVGETIGYYGDIDEFTFAGTGGQTAAASIRALSGFDQVAVRIELLDPAGIVIGDGAILTGGTTTTGAILLTSTGTYTVRVQAHSDGKAVGGYEALLQ